jgi:hypothetical protein
MRVELLPVDAIAFTPTLYECADPASRRRREAGLTALAETIRQVQLLHPILVRQAVAGRYVLIAGQRRLLAYLRLRHDYPDEPRWHAIAAHIYTDENVQDVVLALAENRQREDPPGSTEITQALQSLPISEQLAFLADLRREMAEQARGRQAGGRGAALSGTSAKAVPGLPLPRVPYPAPTLDYLSPGGYHSLPGCSTPLWMRQGAFPCAFCSPAPSWLRLSRRPASPGPNRTRN